MQGRSAASLVGLWIVPRWGWQYMFMIGALPAILALLLRRLLPESPRWLAVHGRVAEAEAGCRRTIYYRYARDDQIRFLKMFDAPSVEECYRRHETIVPQQALVMANSKLVLTRAKDIAAEISQEAGGLDTPGSMSTTESQW